MRQAMFLVCVLLMCCGCLAGCNSTDSRHAARERLEQSVEGRRLAKSRSDEAYANASELIARGNHVEAIPLLLKAVSFDGQNLYAWTALGQARFEVGNIQGSLLAFHRATEIAPGHAGVHYNEGVVLQAVGRYHHAAEAYEEALVQNPDLLEASENLARCYTLLNERPDRVLELVSQALLVETRPDWRIWLGRIKQNLEVEENP